MRQLKAIHSKYSKTCYGCVSHIHAPEELQQPTAAVDDSATHKVSISESKGAPNCESGGLESRGNIGDGGAGGVVEVPEVKGDPVQALPAQIVHEIFGSTITYAQATVFTHTLTSPHSHGCAYVDTDLAKVQAYKRLHHGPRALTVIAISQFPSCFILDYLEPDQLCRLEGVSRQWNQLSREAQGVVQVLDLSPWREQLHPNAFSLLGNTPLQSVSRTKKL